jgi:hypothetical protein
VRKLTLALVGSGFCLAALGCGQAHHDAVAGDGAEPAVPSPSPTALGEAPAPPGLCVAPAGLGRPTTIAEVLPLINALPHPVTLPCFLESLERPLYLNATKGLFSAQPAVGERSPRIFIAVDALLMSVVPEGFGRDYLEFGQLTSNHRSVKAEVPFPVTRELEFRDAFVTLEFPRAEFTTCGVCHAAEVSIDGPPWARESQALRPHPLEDVPVGRLAELDAECDAALEPERCAILRALFVRGRVEQYRFPSEMATFY